MKLSIDEEVTQAFAHADYKSAAAKAAPADVWAVIEEILREASWGEERSGKKANWDETSIEARLFTKREGWIRVYFFFWRNFILGWLWLEWWILAFF